MRARNSAIGSIVDKQRIYFNSGITRDINFRIGRLKNLRESILKNKEGIYAALMNDLHKSKMETYSSEIGIVLDEIRFMIKNLKKWARPKRVRTSKLLFPAVSSIHSEPYGVVLIIAPWNYPFQLLMSPLAGALAAGNAASVKPSELAPNTSKIIKKIVEETFEPEYVSVHEGGVPVSSALLQERFDYIFYTGNTMVGKIVMEAAAKHLTPVTLELGGKSPCIVDGTADLPIAVRRIVWGKLLNAGQTCIAPDYLLVKNDIKERFIELLISEIKKQYGEKAEDSNDYCRIINDKHFARICRLIDKKKIVYGGRSEKKTKFIEPTILDNVGLHDPVMNEEIFGPVLPVIGFGEIDEALEIIRTMEKPLALYLFTGDKKIENYVVTRASFGGGCINDTVIHFINSHLPFGGVGHSGMGMYHGEASFRTFSHFKSIVAKSTHIDIALRYPPHNNKKFDLITRILK